LKPLRYDEPGEAAEFFRDKRAPAGATELPIERYLVAQEHARRMPQYSSVEGRRLPARAAMTREELAALPAWTPLGPGNIGGRTRALVIHPTSPNVMYAAGVAGGVWKTTSAGASWTPVTDLIANLTVSSLAMDPKNPEVLYAGTGEGYFNYDFVRGAGIFKTTDGGATWTRLPGTATANFYFVNDLLVSPVSSQRIYAATRTGLWRSTDGGATWSQSLDPTNSSNRTVTGGCLDLATRTDQTTDYLFAACGTFEQSTIYRNTDAGGSGAWTAVQTESGMGRTSLAVAPSNQNVIYAASASYASGSYLDGLHAVFRSTDGGTSWTAQVRNNNPTKLNTLLFTNPWGAFYGDCGFTPASSNFFANQGWYDNVIAVDPADSNRVWVGGIDLFRSDDGGQNWGLASYWWADGTVAARAPQYSHADHHVIVFHPNYNGTTNKTMFVGNDGGVFRTDDARAAAAIGSTAACSPNNGAITWTALNNSYGVTQFYHGAPYPNGASYFGGTQDNGTLRGSDSGGLNGWSEILGGDGGYVAVDPTNTNILFAENTRLSHKKSTDGGATWRSATSGIYENFRNFLFIAPFVMDASDPKRLWTGGAYIWRTTNGADSWTQASAITAGDGLVSALAVAPTDANYALVGMTQGEILRTNKALTTDYNTSWAFVRPRVGWVSWLAFDPTNRNIAYATYSSFNSSPSDRHVYKSADAGATWTGIDGAGATGLPDAPAHCIVIDPANPQRLYVGTDIGVFASTDGGANWAVENTGFANAITESLSLNVVNGATTLFAFTHGRGAWRVSTNTSGCNFTLAATGQSFGAAGGTGSVALTTDPASCAWTATSNAEWITITSGASGAGNGTINFTVAPGNSGNPRTGTLNIAGRSFVVTQTGCNFNITPTSKSFPAAGGADNITITASPSACTWTATSDSSWITFPSGSGGAGNGALNYAVAANTGATRSGKITIAEQTVTISQLGDPSVCAVTPATIGAVLRGELTSNDCRSPVRGSSFYADRFSFNATAGASVAVEFLSVSYSGYPYYGYLYLISPNGSVLADGYRIPSGGFINLPASGVYTIEVTSSSTSYTTGTYVISLTQGTAGCNYSISATSQSFAATGANGSLNVSAGSACLWTAISDSEWLTVNSGANATGSGAVGYRVAANTSPNPRYGKLIVAGRTVNVTQFGDPSACAITPINTGQFVSGYSGSDSCSSIVNGGDYWGERYSFSGTAGAGVALQFVSSTYHGLRLIDPNGAVVAEGSRVPSSGGFINLLSSGTYLIEVYFPTNRYYENRNYTFALTAGTANCNYGVTSGSQTVSAAGGAINLQVTTGSACAWAALSNANWLTVDTASASGSKTLVVNAAANPTSNPRSGKLIVGGIEVGVTQLGSPDTCTLSPLSVGQVVSGYSGNNGCGSIFYGGSHWGDRYSFNGVAGSGVAIQLLNYSYHYLRLIGPSGTVVADGSRIPSGGFFNLPATGTYLIEVSFPTNYSSYDRNYTLSLTAGTASCGYAITPDSASVAPAGGASSVSVTTGGACAWSAVSASDWLTVANTGSVTGSGAVSVTAAPNPTSTARSGAVVIAGQTFTLRQLGNPEICAMSPISIGQTISGSLTSSDCRSIARGAGDYYADRYVFNAAAGQAISIAVPTRDYDEYLYLIGPDGAALASADSPPIPSSGLLSLPASGRYIIEVTSYSSGRSGNYTLTLTGCSFTLSASSQAFTASSGAGSVNVTTTSGCAWTATSNANWLTISSGASGSGNGAVNFSVAANSGAPRSGTLTIAGQTFTITQEGTNPTPTLSGLNPQTVVAGDPDFTLVINGANFVSGSKARWNGAERATTFVSATQLRAVILASDIAATGAGAVTVFNPTPGGGASGALNVSITANTRALRLVATSGAPGAPISVPLEMTAAGNENAVAFSLTFDPAALANPQIALAAGASGATLTFNDAQAAQGRLGVLIAQPPGNAFAPGARQIAVVTFNVAANPPANSTDVGFGDQPTQRQTASPDAFPLPTTFTGATLALPRGSEADAAPRSNGDGVVTLIDYVQLGRFVAQLDTAAPGSEFQRADCAPRAALGDGRLTVADWTQVGRYVAGLDPVAPAGGPSAPTLSSISGQGPLASGQWWRAPDGAPASDVRLVVDNYSSERARTVAVVLDALGYEQALGFSLRFNPAQWRFVSAVAGSDAQEATLLINANEAKQGRIGVALALPAGRGFAAGARQLVVLRFTAIAEDGAPPSAISFGDEPVAREIADVEARALTARFTADAGALANVSAASFSDGPLARAQIVAAFGNHLAAQTESAMTLPLPTELAGARVVITDSQGAERAAPLFFVSPTQINYQIPPDAALGPATVTIISGDRTAPTGLLEITDVAPALFTANGDGHGAAAAVVLRVRANGSQQFEPAARFDPEQNRFAPAPIDFGEDEQVFLIVYGTGLRGRDGLPKVAATIGGLRAEVLYAGAQGEFTGLDQINLRLPRALAGRGEVELVLNVDGWATNAVRFNFR
jgi:uncharacterized protein (TIGR03437 family)